MSTNRPSKRRRATKPLSGTHPDLMAEWDFERNQANGVSPDEKTHGSGTKVWWLCSECNESWRSIVRSRTRTVRPTGCPFCTGKKVTGWNCLKNNDPLGICKEWHPDNELAPDQVFPGSIKKVKWLCSVGHVWQAPIFNRVKGTACPYCSGRRSTAVNNLKMNDPLGICQEWHPDNKLRPEDVTRRSTVKIKWICFKGHEWEARVTDRSRGTGCPQCHKEGRKGNRAESDRTVGEIARLEGAGEIARAKRVRKADEL